MKEETFVCTSCGEEFPISQCLEFDGQELCQNCLDEETVVCRICGERLWNDDNEGSDSTPLANGLDKGADLSLVETQSRAYYQTALADGSHTAYLILDGGACVGTGGISCYRVMPPATIPAVRKPTS